MTCLIALLVMSCFEYAPNQVILDDDEVNLTALNLARIEASLPGDTVLFAFMGDSQRAYDETEDFVTTANKIDGLSFVIHGGDISDFGLVDEFRWVNTIMSGLTVPYLTAVGNHDLLANGSKVYEKMFGARDYTFDYGDYKFIILDTNSREYDFNGNIPNLNWLDSKLADNPQNRKIIVLSHVPPFSNDFDSNLELEYARLLAENPNVILSLHAHIHSFKDVEYYNDGVRYVMTTNIEKEGFILVKLWDGGMCLEQMEYDL